MNQRIRGLIVAGRQRSLRGWCKAAMGLLILLKCFALEDGPAWGQEPGPAPLPSGAVAMPQGSSAEGESMGDVDDILALVDQSLENLTRKDVVVPAMDVEVSTVSRTESTVGRSPAAVYVVSNEMIRRSGARNIPDVLRLVPGANVARVSANRWAISIRGFNESFANKLLVQIDGRSVYDPLFSGVYWDQQDLPLEDVERIEVIRGPGATVWGANAVNGIINIITKQARDTQGVFAQGGGGMEERAFGALRYGGKAGDSLHYRIYGKWDERDGGWATPDAADDWRVGRGGFRMDWQPDDCRTLTLQGDFYAGRSGSCFSESLPPVPPPGGPPSPPPYARMGVRADDEPAGQNILARFSREVSEESDWSVQLYWDRTERPAPYLFQSCNTFDLDFQHRFPVCDRHSLIWGLGYRNARSVTDGSFTISMDPAIRSFDILSSFVQDEITLREDLLYFTLGSKFSDNDFSGFEIQPTARLLWTPSERQSAWAAVSRAVRTPSRSDQDMTINASLGEFVPIYVVRLGDPDMDSEKLIAYELGYRAQPSDRFWWDLAAFYNDYSELTVGVPGMPMFDPATGITYLRTTLANAVWGDTYGFELAGMYQVNPCWKLSSGYSFLVMNLQGIGSEEAEGRSPRNQVSLQSGWDLGRSWELDMTWRYVDSLSELGIPEYLMMDVRLAWLPSENLEMAVVARNLFDEEHPEYLHRSFSASEVQRGVYGAVTVRY